MSYREIDLPDYKGVATPSVYYDDVWGALQMQRGHLAKNPGDTFSASPISSELDSELWRQRHGHLRYSQYGDVGDDKLSGDEAKTDTFFMQDQYVAIEGNDAIHVEEGLRHQAASLRTSAETSLTGIYQEIAAQQAKRLELLANALNTYFLDSEYNKKHLPKAYADKEHLGAEHLRVQQVLKRSK